MSPGVTWSSIQHLPLQRGPFRGVSFEAAPCESEHQNPPRQHSSPQWHKVWKGQPASSGQELLGSPGGSSTCTAGAPAVGSGVRHMATERRKALGAKKIQGRDTAQGGSWRHPDRQADGQTDRQKAERMEHVGGSRGRGGSSCPVGPGQASCKSLWVEWWQPLCDEAGAFQLTHEGHQPVFVAQVGVSVLFKVVRGHVWPVGWRMHLCVCAFTCVTFPKGTRWTPVGTSAVHIPSVKGRVA